MRSSGRRAIARAWSVLRRRRAPLAAAALVVAASLLLVRGLIGDRFIGFTNDWNVPLLGSQVRAWATQYADGWSPLSLGDFITYNTDLGLRFWISRLTWLGLEGTSIGQLAVVATLVACALSACWLARTVGLGWGPSLATAGAYALSGVVFNGIAYGYLTFMASLAVMPALLVAVLRATRSRRLGVAWTALLCALAVAVVVHIQFVLFAPVAALCAVLSAPSLGRAPWKVIGGRLAWPVGAVAVAYAAIWLPGLLRPDRVGQLVTERTGAGFQGRFLTVWDSLRGHWTTPDFARERAVDLSVGSVTGWSVVVVLLLVHLPFALRGPNAWAARLSGSLILASLTLTALETPPFSLLSPLFRSGPVEVALRNASYALVLGALGLALLAGLAVDAARRAAAVVANRVGRPAWIGPAAGGAVAAGVLLVAAVPWADGAMRGAVTLNELDVEAYRRAASLGEGPGRVLRLPVNQPFGIGETPLPWGFDTTKGLDEIPGLAFESPSGRQLANLYPSMYEDPTAFASALERLRVGTILHDRSVVSRWEFFIFGCQPPTLRYRQYADYAALVSSVPGLRREASVGPVEVYRAPARSQPFPLLSRGAPVWAGPLGAFTAGLPLDTALSDRDLPGAAMLVGSRPADRLLDLLPASAQLVDRPPSADLKGSACDGWTANNAGLAFWWDRGKVTAVTTFTTFASSTLTAGFVAPEPGRYHVLVELLSSPRGSRVRAVVSPTSDEGALERTWSTTSRSGTGFHLRHMTVDVGSPGRHVLRLESEAEAGAYHDQPKAGENAVARIAVLSDADYRTLRRSLSRRLDGRFVLAPGPVAEPSVVVALPRPSRLRVRSETSGGAVIIGGRTLTPGDPTPVAIPAGRHEVRPAVPARVVERVLAGRPPGALQYEEGRMVPVPIENQEPFPPLAPRPPGASTATPLAYGLRGLRPGALYRLRVSVCVEGPGPGIRVLNVDGFPIALDRLAGPACDGGDTASWEGLGFRPRWSEAIVQIWGGEGVVRGVEAERLEGGLPEDLRIESEGVDEAVALALDASGPADAGAIATTHSLARPVSGPDSFAVRLPVNSDDRWTVSLLRDGRRVAPAGLERFVADGYGNGWLVTLAPGQSVDAVRFSRDDETATRILVALTVIAVPALLLVSALGALAGRARRPR